MANDIELTPEQIEAIGYSHEKPAIVAAAAGSGKTTLLVDRVVRLLSDMSLDIPADSAAIMTFTRNATKSMREKLNRALTEKMNSLAESALVEDREQYDYLKKQTFALRQAAISTIDAFCLRIIKENAEAFELPLNFTIADGAKKAAMQSQAMKAAMQEFYGDDFSGEERNALFFSFSFEDDTALEKAVLSVSDMLSSCADPEKWMADALDAYKDISSVEKHFLGLIDNALSLYVRRAELCCAKYGGECIYDRLSEEVADKRANTKGKNAALDDMENLVLPAIKKYIEFDEKRIGQLKSDFDAYKNAPSIKALGALFKNFEDNSAAPPELYGRKGNTYSYKKLFNKTSKSISETGDKLLKIKIDSELEEKALPDMRKAIETFFKLLKIFNEYYGLEKMTSGCVDFSDCERELYNKLSENGGDNDFRRQLSKRFSCVIVDEFQDSNDIQAEIFSLLGGDRLFYVGDVKQSIYSFRGADPYIMADICDGKRGSFKTLKLGTNFRSRKAVVDTVNAAFDGIMTRQYGGVDYSDNNGLTLSCGLPEPEPERKELYDTEMVLVKIPKKETAEGEKDKDMTLPRLTARKIRELLDNENFLVSDGKDENGNFKYKRPSYSDFIILLRTKGKIECYRKALAELGVPSAAPKGSNFFEADEIVLIYNFLKVIDNPLSDEEMLKVLMSPIYRFSAEETARIKMGILGIEGLDGEKLRDVAGTYRRRSLYSCVLDCATNKARCGKEKIEVDRRISLKLLKFLGDIKSFRYYMNSSSLDDLVRKIYEDTELTAIVAAFEDSAGRVENIRRMQKTAADFEARGGGNLADFLRFLDRAKENSDRGIEEAARPENGSNAVRIMTFHASKGLEAPVCIMSELQNPMNHDDYTGNPLVNFTHFMAMTYTDVKHRKKTKLLPYHALSRFIRERQLGDELRLLYVAMTRAKEKLIMITSVNKDNYDKLNETVNGDPIDPELHDEVYDTSVPFSCVMNSLLQYAPLIDENTKQFRLDGIDCRVTALDSAEMSAKTDVCSDGTDENKECAVSESDVSHIAELIKKKYAHPEDTEQQAKYTTTELAHQKSAKPISLTKPLFAAGNTVSGVEKGNAYHHCMQHFPLESLSAEMDFEEALRCVEETINKLVSARKITEDERNIIESGRVAKFFTGELGRRMLRAYSQNHENVKREQSFYAEVLGNEVRRDYDGVISIQGQIDMYFVENGEIIVVDYKSDTIENLAKEQENYEFQVEIYTKILGKLTGMKVKEMYLYAFLADKEMKI